MYIYELKILVACLLSWVYFYVTPVTKEGTFVVVATIGITTAILINIYKRNNGITEDRA